MARVAVRRAAPSDARCLSCEWATESRALREAGISLTTIRIAVGDEDPRGLLAHLMQAAELALEPECPGFTRHFGQPHEIDGLYESIYVDVHRRYAASRPRMQQMLSK